MIEKTCLNCTKLFKLYPSQKKRKKFCCIQCKVEGQSKGLTAPMRKGTGRPEYQTVWRRKYDKYRSSDKKKLNESVDFTFHEMIEILENGHCVYCNSSDKQSLGFDRLENNLPHIKSNIVIACELCNTTKGHRFSFDQMKLLGKVIQTFNMDGWRVMSRKSINKMMDTINGKVSK